MIPIQALLNKIRWDKQEHPEEYVLFHYDRIKDTILSRANTFLNPQPVCDAHGAVV